MRATALPPATSTGETTHTFTDQQAQPLMMRVFALFVTFAMLAPMMPALAWAAPVETVTITNQVIGVEDGAPVVWAAAGEQSIPAGTTAWDASAEFFAENDLVFVEGAWGGYPDSITHPDGTQLIAGPVGDGWAFWAFYINNMSASVGAGGYTLQDGDSISWIYIDGKQNPTPPGYTTIDPYAVRPAYSAFWPQFGRAGSAVAGGVGPVVQAPALTTANTTGLEWSYRFGDLDSGKKLIGFANASDPLIVNNEIYLASTRGTTDPITWGSNYGTSRLDVISRKTGKALRSVELISPIDTTCRPVYTDGLVIVPLLGGRIQAFTADNLTCVWVTDGIKTGAGADQKPLSSMTVHDGNLFVGMTSGWGDSEGVLQSVNIDTGEINWQNTYIHGFYWAGSTIVSATGSVVEKYLAIGGDDGRVSLIEPATGAVKHSLHVGEKVRSSIVAQGSDLYFTTADGMFHKLNVDNGGALVDKGSVALGVSPADAGAAGSTSTPTIYGGHAYVGGHLGYRSDFSSIGVIAAINLSTMTISKSATFDGETKSAPLVVVQNGEAHAYFTANADRGGVYVFSAETGVVEEIFAPEDLLKNYAMSSVISGSDGVLYYTNDSGTLFALKKVAAPTPNEPTDPKPDAPKAPAKKPVKKPAKTLANAPAKKKTPASVNPGFVETVELDELEDTSLETTETVEVEEPDATATQEDTSDSEAAEPIAISSPVEERSPLENKLKIAFAVLIALAAIAAAGIAFMKRKRLGGAE